MKRCTRVRCATSEKRTNDQMSGADISKADINRKISKLAELYNLTVPQVFYFGTI